MSEEVKDILPVVIAEIAEKQANKQRAEYDRRKACFQRRVAKVYQKSAEKIIKLIFVCIVVAAIYCRYRQRVGEIKV